MATVIDAKLQIDYPKTAQGNAKVQIKSHMHFSNEELKNYFRVKIELMGVDNGIISPPLITYGVMITPKTEDFPFLNEKDVSMGILDEDPGSSGFEFIQEEGDEIIAKVSLIQISYAVSNIVEMTYIGKPGTIIDDSGVLEQIINRIKKISTKYF